MSLYRAFSQSYNKSQQRWDYTNGHKTSVIIDHYRNGKISTIEGGTSTGDTSIGGSDLHLAITATQNHIDRTCDQRFNRGGGGGGVSVSCGGQTPPTPTVGKTLLNTSPNLLPITTASDTFNNLKNLVKIDKGTVAVIPINNGNTGSNYRKGNSVTFKTAPSIGVIESRNGTISRSTGAPGSGHFSTGYNKNSVKIRQHDSEVSPRPRRTYQSDSSSSRYYIKNSDILGQNGNQSGITGVDTYHSGRYTTGGVTGERDYQQANSSVYRSGRNYHQNSDGGYNRNLNSGNSGSGSSIYRTQQHHNTRYENGNGNGQQRPYGNIASNAGYNSHLNQNGNIKSYVPRNSNDGNVTIRSNYRDDYTNNYRERERDFENSPSNHRYISGAGGGGGGNNNNSTNSLERNKQTGGRYHRSHLELAANGIVNSLTTQTFVRNEERYERTYNNRSPPLQRSGNVVTSNTDVANANTYGSSVVTSRGNSPPISQSQPQQQQLHQKPVSTATPPPAAGRWIPPSLRPQHGLTQFEKNDAVYRKVRGILNKLTPEKFQELSDELLKLDLNSIVILKGVILLIFEKSLDEPKYSSMYAQLCKRLSEEAPSFEKDPNSSCTFLRLLIAVCHDKFDNRLKRDENDNRPPPENEADEEERRHLAKQRMLGNVKFIGELNKLDMLSKNVLHECIVELLDKKKKRATGAQEMCEDMECLAQLLKTCGKNLDSEQSKELMNLYFEKLERRSKSTEYPPRIRFMLKDVVELRQNNWIPRKIGNTEGPVPIKQIRSDDDNIIRTPFANRNRDMRNNDRDSDNWMNRFHLNLQVGYNDMFGSLSVTGSSPIVSPFSTSGSGGNNNRDNRQFNNRDRNNQNSVYNNRYNKHNQNGNHNRDDVRSGSNMNRDQNNFQYGGNQLSGSKELAPRFKRNYYTTNQDAVENLQMRPAPNSLLFRAAVQNQKLPTTLPITTPPNPNSQAKELQQLSNTQYPILGTPTSHFVPPVRPASTPSAEYAENRCLLGNLQPNAIDRSIKLTTSTPNFGGTITSLSGDKAGIEQNSIDKKHVANGKPQQQLITKNGSTERPETLSVGVSLAKQQKKDKGPSKEEMLKKAANYFKENFYYNNEDETEESNGFTQLIDGFIELKLPEKCLKDVCICLVMEILDRVNDVYLERVVHFLQTLRKQSNIKPNIIIEIFKQIVNKMNEREALNPRITTLVANLLSKAVCETPLIKLNDIANFTDNGQHYPLFLLVLQQLHKAVGKEALEEMYRNSKVDLMNNLQEVDRNKERLAEILEDRQLAFLYPLLKVQSEMLKQLVGDSTPTNFYKWIKSNVDAKYYKDPGFIQALMTVVVKYITKETTLTEGTDIKKLPEKAVTEKEKTLLDSFSNILRKFLGQAEHQLIALYALQVFCYNEKFPKGLLYRWFKNLYDDEVIEEDTYMKWKEEINEKFPGKREALFQVNTWLTWLQEAESEDDD